MTNFRLVHRTRYAFDDAVVSPCELTCRVRPRPVPGQHLTFHQLVATPRPLRREPDEDDFGNPLERLTIAPPYGTIETTAVSHVSRQSTSKTAVDTAWMSFCVGPGADVDDIATEAFAPDRSMAEALDRWLKLVSRRYAFDGRITKASPSLEQFVASRRGVCQDFSRLAVTTFRALGLRARYVSGYATHVMDRPVAAHAWTAVKLGDDWLDIDPTHGRSGHLGHITLAWGDELTDVAPVTGQTAHQGRYRLESSVVVSPLPN